MFCSRCGTQVNDDAKFCPSCGLDLVATSTAKAVTAKPEEASEADLVREALKDEYEIVKELGRGGMAIVFKAREKALDREVAVKVLPFSLAFDAEFVERFQREARTAAKLEHPHIIPIYRVGKSGRVIYFVMKFLRGKSLSDVVEERGALPPDEIRRLLIQTSGALGYAHKNGIVHRDIKPDNIMFDESGNAIVTDFGIAKAASGTRLTGTGMAIGTPHYMSPEQARAQPLDGRSDIYSLGVVAYQCLAGRVPFDGEDSFAIGYKHIMEELPQPPLLTAEQRQLFRVIQKMMAKSPDDRFQSAEELIAVLEGRAVPPVTAAKPAPLSSEAATTVLPATPAGARPGVQTTPTTPMPRTQPPAPAVRKKRSGVLVGMFTVLLLGGGGAGGYWYFVMGPGARAASGSASSEQSAVSGPIAAAHDAGARPADSLATGDTATAAAAALPNVGWVSLANLPTRGATVTVDGERKQGAMIEVPPGSRKVRVERAGFVAFDTTVLVERGDTVGLQVVLTAAAAAERPVTAPLRRQAEQQPRAADPQPQPPRAEPPPAPPADLCQPGPNWNHESCFDTAPSVQGVPLVDPPAGTTALPDPVTLWVLVGTDGKPVRVERQTNPPNVQFLIAAMRWASQAQYRPATKGGRPIEAWYRLTVAPRPPR